ncbi:probable NADH dehydrogenase [ubiquinone] 1 alpha subcomplex subunit 5, mitochondrial [Tanacetum coccineum]
MFLRRFARPSSSLKMMSAKETAAIVVVPNSREVLIGLYSKTLNIITRVPEDEGYRKSIKSLTRQRLAICEAEKDVENIEKQIGKVDELIDEAKFEYKVLDKLLVLIARLDYYPCGLAYGDRGQGFDPHSLQGRRSFSTFGRTESSLSTLGRGMASPIHRGRRY